MTATPIIRGVARARLNTGCAMALALMFAVQAEELRAQAFQGTSLVTSGSATVTTGLNLTQIVVNSPEVVIDWTPSDVIGVGPIDFLPSGKLANFIDNGSALFTSYTVLNRINPVDQFGQPVARTVALNGQVQSGLGQAVGGNIWFYSPTGIIVGSKATIAVGSLILTTDAIDTTGGLFGAGTTVRFRGPAGSTGTVDINQGAQVSALGQGAYLALVAPRVVQSGTVSADGSIAYVAAEQADILINAGLFGISIIQGTTDPNGIVHDGTTTGPASTGVFDRQELTMIAMPKNTALTMLLGGSMGYVPAAVAAQDGSTVVLSAGYTSNQPGPVQGSAPGNISIGDRPTTAALTAFTSPLTALATDTIAIAPSGSGTVDFGTFATLSAEKTLTATAVAGSIINARNDLVLNARLLTQGGALTLNALGKSGPLTAGKISVTGNLFLNAFAAPVTFGAGNAVGADSIGGTISVRASGGTISAPQIFADASAFGESGKNLGGAGLGGRIVMQASAGGGITSLTLVALTGGNGGYSPIAAGRGVGGSILLQDQGGSLGFGSVGLFANGTGGPSELLTGDGIGGSIQIDIAALRHRWASLTADSTAFRGLALVPGATAGNATGRRDGVIVTIAKGGLDVTNFVTLQSDAIAGIAGSPTSFGTAGGTSVLVSGGGILTAGGAFLATARAQIATENFQPGPQVSPQLQGGNVDIRADSGGTIKLIDLTASTSAAGAGALTRAGSVTGGATLVGAFNGGTITVDNGQGSAATVLDGDGLGGGGTRSANAFGGSASLIASDGTLDLRGPTTVSASARAGALAASTPGAGFAAIGGTALVALQPGVNGTGAMLLGALAVRADGNASFGGAFAGNGGIGTGGNAQATVAAGNLTSSSVTVQANGLGGHAAANGGAALRSGDGIGGTAALVLGGGTVNIPTLNVLARGQGGGLAGPALAGQVVSLAGAGSGGNATLSAAGGALTATTLLIDAGGNGGLGMDNANGVAGATGAAGGGSSGGTAQLLMPAVSSARIDAPFVTVRADALGGAGGGSTSSASGNGGNAVAGTARLGISDGRFALGTVGASAVGTGGAGATGGGGTGGAAAFALSDTLSGLSTPRTLGAVTLNGSGIGGASLTGPIANTTAGSTRLVAQTGSAGSALAINGDFKATSTGTTAPAGDGFTMNLSGAPLTIGGNATILTARDATLTLAANAPLTVTGTLNLTSRRAVNATGSITSGLAAAIVGDTGVTMAGLASGGTTLLRAINGPVTVSALNSAGLVTVLGRSVDLTSPGALAFFDADATAGPLSVRTVGNLDLTTVDATGAITLTSTAGALHTTGAVNGNGIAMGAFGNILADANLTSGAALSLAAGGSVRSLGTVSAAGNASVIAPLGIDMAGLASGGTTLLRAINGPITVSALNSAGLVTVLGRSVDLASPGALAFFDADATAGPLSVRTVGNLDLTTVDATGAVTLTSTAGALHTSGAVNGSAITLAAFGNVLADANLASTGALTITAGGSVRSLGIASALGNASIIAPLGITMASLQSGGTTLLRAVNGAISALSLTSSGLVTVLGRSVDVASPNALAFFDADATAGNLTIRTVGNLDLSTVDATGAITLTSSGGGLRTTGAINGADIALTGATTVQADANLTAANSLIITAGGAYTGNARASGRTVAIGSGDVVLGAAGQLGQRGVTQTLTLTNTRPVSQTSLGGAGLAGSYALSSAEMARLFAEQRIVITVSGGLPVANIGDFVLGDFAMSYGAAGNIGSGGELKILTPGRVAVIGGVQLTTSGATDTFSIDPTRIDISADTGSIVMRSAAGALGGRLNLVAATVDVVSAAALPAIATAPTVQITDRLALSDGKPSDTGYLQAGQITVTASNAFYLQNSGSSLRFADRRGFTANSLAIQTIGSATRIVINGAIVDATGALVTGLDTAAKVTINGLPATSTGQFDTYSSINGCIIGLDCRSFGRIAPPGSGLDGVLVPGSGSGGGIGNFSPSLLPLIEVAERQPIGSPPLIDEPVTGIGNDDLWQKPCSDERDKECPGKP